ncbi:MAG: pyridoxal phosphate-dependent aminotransferase [Sulfuritalea sp.]|jgi:aspartate/methionine/tyrosine aminotransferase|nr:pyridoxal phosphate-dependent aminotransferase [Sulfuritalea sp.]MBP6637537.1 pyridoxal phosphate-dependent aminotransferase [Sulfuritalea sp.]
MKLASRMKDIAPFHVMELMAKAAALEAAGRSVIHFEVGEPDFATAEPILVAGQEFLRGGHVHYTAALGLPQLREAISGFYRQRYGLDVPSSRIVVTAGASGALLLALGVLVNPGDEWLLPDPGYPCNRHFLRLLEGTPVSLPVNADSDFQPTADALASAWGRNTRGLLVASPANPTGAVVPQLRLAELSAAIADRGGNLVVDEIYHGLTYGFEADTALALDNEVFVINSFSKYFGMTGWRLGWLVAPERHVREIEKLAQNLYIAPSTLAQHAALAAFHPATIAIFEHRRREFQARRDLMLPGLERLGFGVAAQPRGAFYIYADSSQLGPDSRILAERLLADAGVAATPGLDFGSNEPRRHMRFAYTVEQARIAEGLARMEKLLA